LLEFQIAGSVLCQEFTPVSSGQHLFILEATS
jgi:hypothetical protein